MHKSAHHLPLPNLAPLLLSNIITHPLEVRKHHAKDISKIFPWTKHLGPIHVPFNASYNNIELMG
jgi:hypothetical protein